MAGISSGKYPPGSRLREDEIAEAAGVSRTPVREALNRLQAEGFVRIVRNRGAEVVGWTAQDLDDIFELRVLLEGYGVRRAASRRVDTTTLREICDRTDAVFSGDGDRKTLSELAIEFHTELHRLSGSRQLLSILPILLGAPMVLESFHHHTERDLSRAYDQHRELVEAIDAGDGDWADGVMRAHLRAGRHSLLPMEMDSADQDAGTGN